MTNARNQVRNLLRFATFFILIFQLIIGFGYTPAVYAADPVPSKEDLINQVNQEVQDDMAKKGTPDAQEVTNQASGNTGSNGGNNTDVVNTGGNADVDTSTSNDNNTTVNNNNNANVNQTVNAEANTGHNEAKGNISFGGHAGVIQTGDAVVNVDGSVSANNNTTGVSGGGSGTGNDTSVTNSGNGVSTTTHANGSTTTTVNNNNNATIHQSANADANTGNNDASGNIAIGGGMAGVILTGDAWVDIDFMTVANGSATLVGGSGNGDGPGNGADIYITNTGGRFSGIGRLYQRTSTLVNNNNNAVINQNCGSTEPGESLKRDQRAQDSGCTSDTGHNDSSNNIAWGADAGVIQTGDAIVDVSMNASANNNATGVSNGNGGVDNNTDVVNTGNNADVDTSAASETNTTINNNNNATVNQNVNAYANTGYNKANYNISFGGNAGIIQTGNAVVNVAMNADVNDNTTQVSGASASLDGSHGGGNDTHVVNTGNNADIDTTVTNNSNTIVNNNNSLNMLQALNSHTNTGNNTASDNVSLGGDANGCLFSRFACAAGIGGSTGVIGTGNAFIQGYINAAVNNNTTGDPTTPASSPVQQSNNDRNLNDTNTSAQDGVDNLVAQLTGTPQQTGGTYVIAGTASQQNDDGTVSRVGASMGYVLAAATAMLPATGAADSFIILAFAAALFGAGIMLRKFTVTKVNSRKEVKQ